MARWRGWVLCAVLAGWSTPVAAAPPSAAQAQQPSESESARPADDFRHGDPREADLGPVAESSGLSRETAAQPRGDTLGLHEVIAAITAADPRLEAAERAREIAQAKLLSARGGFDTKAKVRGVVQPLGYYTHGVIDTKLEQPTPLWGMSLWTGWRLGLGDFAVYDGKLLTAAGGEVRTGVSLPLWQGGPIDRTRADLRQARIEVARKTALRDAKTLALEAKAAAAYWDWVAAGLRLEVERTLLGIALERGAGLERQIELGNLESLVGADNHRLILDREGRIVTAEREFQAATLELSLFLRDDAGAPRLAGADRLPSRFPEVTAPALADIEAEVEAAIARRPDLREVQGERQQAEVELRWAKNQRAPRIDVSAWVAKDLGPGPAALLPVEVAAAIEIEVPIPMRKARGQYRAARAELGRIDAELRFARDRVSVEVRDAHSALAAAFQQARLAGEQVELARTLAAAELRRFELGAGDLLLVNLRELAAADAAAKEIDALAAYFTAVAKLEVATGRGVGE